MLRFDVFGRLVGVKRKNGAWQVYDLGHQGKRVTARDLIVAPDVPESAPGPSLRGPCPVSNYA
jgi:hypothetical protein